MLKAFTMNKPGDLAKMLMLEIQATPKTLRSSSRNLAQTVFSPDVHSHSKWLNYTWAIVGNAQVALWTCPGCPALRFDKTFYVTLMLLVSCPGCPFTLVYATGHSAMPWIWNTRPVHPTYLSLTLESLKNQLKICPYIVNASVADSPHLCTWNSVFSSSTLCINWHNYGPLPAVYSYYYSMHCMIFIF